MQVDIIEKNSLRASSLGRSQLKHNENNNKKTICSGVHGYLITKTVRNGKLSFYLALEKREPFPTRASVFIS